MRAVIEFAMDREAPEMISTFVEPLDELLRNRFSGRVQRCVGERPGMFFAVQLKLFRTSAMELVLQFLAEVDAPVGTLTYRLDCFGRKRDIMILGTPPEELDPHQEAEPNTF
jgi:hypothetical protein